MIERMFRWFDQRLGAASFARKSLRKIFPDHWSFMLGEIALYCFVILVITGVFLTFFYVPDSATVAYHGRYLPLQGQTMSRAYESVLRLSFDVRSGLVFRQIHHWAALVMVGAVAVHASRVFFTGAFRKPRELNWVIGVSLLLLTLGIGFVGYSLPDDLLSGTGLRIAYSVVLSIPVIGTWMAFLLFGGEYPSPDLLPRLFVLHVMILPALIAATIGIHLAILWRQKHTNFPERGLQPDHIRGERLWPRYAFKSIGFLFVIWAVLSMLGGLVQINPIWLYGPYSPHIVSQAAQPDWYMGWLEGLIRLFPNWQISLFGYEIPELFFPSILIPGLFFTILAFWPWIERRFTGDIEAHDLLEYPRELPWRTALGASVLTFFVLLSLAGGDDVLASDLGISIEAFVRVFRVVVIVVPGVVFILTYLIAHGLRKSGLEPVKRSVVMEVSRRADGGFASKEEEGGGFPSTEERLREAADQAPEGEPRVGV
jgi:ubiquinol-cytochrome c reductase cytochrome b subunit